MKKLRKVVLALGLVGMLALWSVIVFASSQTILIKIMMLYFMI